MKLRMRMKQIILISFLLTLGLGLQAQDSTTPEVYGESATAEIQVVHSSTSYDIDATQIKIYPNPSTDFIQIANDNNVSKIAIYNIVGKNLNTSSHYEGKSHDVSSLQKGIYLIRLFDENEKVLSVLRLKKSGGA